MTTSAQPATAAPKYKRSIKNYMLDARFQLKWTGYILLVALTISSLLGGFLYTTSRQVTEQSQKVILQGDALIGESQKNSDLVKMQIREQYADAPELADAFNKKASDLDQGLVEKHRQLQLQAAQTRQQQTTMLMSLVASLTLLVILIGLLGIYFTHKVVGPIYKMKMLLGQVGAGKLNFKGGLRKGDELQDFFAAFNSMVDKLKDRQTREVTELDAAIDAARASGANDEAIAKIARVRDEMKASLEK